ncbi:F-box-like domain-containing protein, partial [Cephalotus follicularis]
IKSLPHELLLEVVSRVASLSLYDLLNAKLICKDFLNAAKEDYVFQHVSMDKFPVVPWKLNEESYLFINRCLENGNAEALYREGMKEYFSYKKQEFGIEKLKKAAEKGHVDASYVYGMISLCLGNDGLKQEGLKVLSSFKSRGFRIKQCRERVKGFLGLLWVNNIVARKQGSWHAKACSNRENTKEFPIERKQRWQSSEEEDIIVSTCDLCLWDHEVDLFCNMLQ